MLETVSGVVLVSAVAVIWVSLGLGAVIYLGRHGLRSPSWMLVAIVLGPIFVPIALELPSRQPALLAQQTPDSAGVSGRVRVLAAIDGSRESVEATRIAARALAGEHSYFTLLAVIPPDIVEDLEAAKSKAQGHLDAAAAELPTGTPAPQTEIRTGDPAQVIIDRAAADTVDMIVIGRRGRGLSRKVFGSVAERVVRSSPRPVLLGAEGAPV